MSEAKKVKIRTLLKIVLYDLILKLRTLLKMTANAEKQNVGENTKNINSQIFSSPSYVNFNSC